MPCSAASCATGDSTIVRPRPARASGRVTTATTSCRLAISARNEGRAVSGVPAKTILIAAESRDSPFDHSRR